MVQSFDETPGPPCRAALHSGEMPMSRFEIAFSGQLVAGARPEVVKANLAKLFPGRRAAYRTAVLRPPGGDQEQPRCRLRGKIPQRAGASRSDRRGRRDGDRGGGHGAAACAAGRRGSPQARVAARDSAPSGRLQVSAAGRLHGGVRRGRCAGFRPCSVGADLQDAKAEAERRSST